MLRVWIDGYPLENRLQRGIGRVLHQTTSMIGPGAAITVGLRQNSTWPSIEGVAVSVCPNLNRGPIDPATGRRDRTSNDNIPIWLAETNVYHSHFFVPCPAPGRFVVQHVHDMLPERMPDVMGSWGKRETLRKRQAILNADALICLSAATRDELRRVYPQLRTPMRVVYPAGDHLSPATSYGRVGSFVLYVGHRHVYKNFRRVLLAMRSSAWPAGLHLEVVGRTPNVLERMFVHRYRLKNRVRWLGALSDSELAIRYATAAAFVFPSLMEGFGLPILEAQLNRCPLVASDIPVFREVGGDAAEFFDPYDSDSLAEAVGRAAASRQRCIDSGLANAQRFSWKRSAQETLEVYQNGYSNNVGLCRRGPCVHESINATTA